MPSALMDFSSFLSFKMASVLPPHLFSFSFCFSFAFFFLHFLSHLYFSSSSLSFSPLLSLFSLSFPSFVSSLLSVTFILPCLVHTLAAVISDLCLCPSIHHTVTMSDTHCVSERGKERGQWPCKCCHGNQDDPVAQRRCVLDSCASHTPPQISV